MRGVPGQGSGTGGLWGREGARGRGDQRAWGRLGMSAAAEAAEANPRLTRTHGCFEIDGLPRPALAEGARDRWYDARELTFEPGPALTDDALLTSSERAAYDRDGYVVCAAPLLSSAEVKHHAALWEACMRVEHEGQEGVTDTSPGFTQRRPEPGVRGDAVNGHFKKYGGCLDLVSHPRVVQLARDVLGPNVCCWGGELLSVPAPEARVDRAVRRALHRQAARDVGRASAVPSRRLVLGVLAHPPGHRLARTGRMPGGERCCSLLPRLPSPRPAAPGGRGGRCVVRPAGGRVRGAPARTPPRRPGAPRPPPLPHSAGPPCSLPPHGLRSTLPCLGLTLTPCRDPQASAHSDLTAHISSGPNHSRKRRLGIAITYTQMDGVSDGGLGWATGVYIPPGSSAPSEGWVELPPPAAYAPAGFDEPPPGSGARL